MRHRWRDGICARGPPEGVYHTDFPFSDQFCNWQDVAAVTNGNPNNKPQMRCDQILRCHEILLVSPRA